MTDYFFGFLSRSQERNAVGLVRSQSCPETLLRETVALRR